MATAAEIRADIAALRAARLSLVNGERVKEVWRDGRKLVFGEVTLDGLTKLMNTLKADLVDADLDEAGEPRRRAIGIRYSN